MFKPLSNYPCQDHFKTVKEWAGMQTLYTLKILKNYNRIDV
tara:strand:+ start:2015 stop:2137 length:123 start_codon:yes stop_codon:yes gene_type:complete